MKIVTDSSKITLTGLTEDEMINVMRYVVTLGRKFNVDCYKRLYMVVIDDYGDMEVRANLLKILGD